MSVFRIYVEKKPPFAVESKSVLKDVKSALKLDNLKALRIVNRYDVEGLSKEDFILAIPTVFSEPAVDIVYSYLPTNDVNEQTFAIEYLPGQFDQRADSCEQCISLLTQSERPVVKSTKVYIADGKLSDSDITKLKNYLINPVESREASLSEVETLDVHYEIPTTVESIDGFIYSNDEDLKNMIKSYGLAMDFDDIKFCQSYFKDTEKRNPTITEIRMIDTYWSDHCRHTTFSTIIDNVTIQSDYILDTYNKYLQARNELYVGKNKPINGYCSYRCKKAKKRRDFNCA